MYRYLYAHRFHYNDVIMSVMASQITSLTISYLNVYSSADQRKHQSVASLAFVRGNSPVTGEFRAQRASNAETVSIWWRHHVVLLSFAVLLVASGFIWDIFSMLTAAVLLFLFLLYSPSKDMHTILLYFHCCQYIISNFLIHVIHLLPLLRVVSFALGQQ